MRSHGVKKFVFFFGLQYTAIRLSCRSRKNARWGKINNGETKAMQGCIPTDIWKADNEWQVMLLRYFNPIGAHESGLIGKTQRVFRTICFHYVAQVASGKPREGACFRK